MRGFIFQIGNNFFFKNDLGRLSMVLLFNSSLQLQKDKIVQDVNLGK
jgi:hypothetical protein